MFRRGMKQPDFVPQLYSGETELPEHTMLVIDQLLREGLSDEAFELRASAEIHCREVLYYGRLVSIDFLDQQGPEA